MPIEEKHQLIDDESHFRIEELEGLNQTHIKALNKTYNVLSIIGSQSSGKSTLLNALFGTTFEQLNRKKRVGQTTKGIWYSMNTTDSLMVIDVEGSDSNEREERTKIERRNSLFALAVSHTLLINMWIQQIGLYKGSQLAILEIILELNLRLFGAEEPKNIIFVVRDYCSNRENLADLEEKLFSKVREAWTNIKKPPGKEHVQLTDLFKLQACFMPSKIDEPEDFADQAAKLRGRLVSLAANQKVIKSNVAMEDVPQFMKNLWETIEADKDINLPREKVLLSNMKCHEAKKAAFEEFQDEFRDELERSERKMNMEFAVKVKGISGRMLAKYDGETGNYIPEEVAKVREEFVEELDRKIELSFSYQVKHIVDECLREFTDEMNKLFIKDKSIESIKALLPQTLAKFQDLLKQVSVKAEWSHEESGKFERTLEETYRGQKERIIVDSLKDFDRAIKKQVESLVSNAFYEKKIFCGDFWGYINSAYKEVEHKAKNSIIGLYNKLEFKAGEGRHSQFVAEHVQRARNNAHEELVTVIGMKCNDLLYYMMRHFSVDFNLDEQEIPRQWPTYQPEQIAALFDTLKTKYTSMIPNFIVFELEAQGDKDDKAEKVRATMKESTGRHKQLLGSAEIAVLNKKLVEQMENEYQEAVKKNKQVYMGAIPKWGWVLFLLVAFDDVLLWLKSPYLAIPITLVLLAIGLVFMLGGRTLATSLLSNARRTATSMATQATTRMMTRDS